MSGSHRIARDLALALGAFLAAALVAEALGATNLGTALGFAQIAFLATVIWLLLKR